MRGTNDETERRDVIGVVEVPPVRVGGTGLVLRDGVHERVTGARVHLEQALDADGERAEVAGGRQRRDADARADEGAGVDVDASSPRVGARQFF